MLKGIRRRPQYSSTHYHGVVGDLNTLVRQCCQRARFRRFPRRSNSAVTRRDTEGCTALCTTLSPSLCYFSFAPTYPYSLLVSPASPVSTVGGRCPSTRSAFCLPSVLHSFFVYAAYRRSTQGQRSQSNHLLITPFRESLPFLTSTNQRFRKRAQIRGHSLVVPPSLDVFSPFDF